MPGVDRGASIPPPSLPPAARPESRAGWGPSRAFLGILVLLLIVAVEAVVVGAFDPNLKSLAAKLSLQAALAVTLAGVAFVMASAGGGFAAPAALGLRRPRGRPARTALAAYLAYFAFVIAYSALANPHQKDLTRDLGYGHGVATSILVGFLIVLAAPMAEEIFFRGFVFGGLRQRLPFAAAGVISAVIFGAFHYTGSGSLTVLPQLAVLGLALAWVYERTDSIFPTIAIHVINNALAFAILTS